MQARTAAEAACRRGAWLTLVLIAFGCVANQARAADWRLTPSVSANQVYSDNIELNPSGEESHDFVTTLNAGASLRGTGRRLQVNLDYNLQRLMYARSTSADTTRQQWQADASSELVEQIVFLEARTTMSQQNISNTGRQDSTNIALTGNTTDVLTYSVTPIVRHHFGGIGDAEARYEFSKVDADGNAGSGKTTDLSTLISSGREFPKLPWSISTRNTRIDNDSGSKTRFQNIEGTARYKFTRQYGVLASAGYESNDFASSRGDGDSGVIWSIGGIWTPTPRTSVEAGYTRRYFDPSYFLNASHRSRRMVFTASYSEDLTTTSQRLLDRELIPLEDAFGEPILEPISGDQIGLPIFDETLTDEVQINRTLRGSTSYSGRRGTATVSVFNTLREFQVSGDEDHTFGLSVSTSRRLSHRATLSVNGSWTRQNPQGAGGDSTQWQLGSVLTYTVASDVTASLDLRRLTRDSDTPSDNYDEHRVTLRVDVSF